MTDISRLDGIDVKRSVIDSVLAGLCALIVFGPIVGIVLNLPTIGPLLYSALTTEDMFLAASTVMISMALTLVGTFISDILLVILDPRIQYE